MMKIFITISMLVISSYTSLSYTSAGPTQVLTRSVNTALKSSSSPQEPLSPRQLTVAQELFTRGNGEEKFNPQETYPKIYIPRSRRNN